MTTEAKPPTGEEPGQNPEGKDDGKGTDTSKQNQDADKKFTQADIDVLIKDRLKRQQDAFEKKLADEKRLAEEAKAKEQGEFQKLAENRQKDLDDLTPKYEAAEAELKELKPAFAALIDAELKVLPDEVVESGPAKYDESKALTNPLEVSAWLPKGKALAKLLNDQPVTRGARSDPRAKGEPGDADKDKRDRREASRAYRE